MGGCNSTSGGLVQGLDRRCARGIRGHRTNTNNTDPSSSSSSSSSSSPRASHRIPGDNQPKATKSTSQNCIQQPANNKTAKTLPQSEPLAPKRHSSRAVVAAAHASAAAGSNLNSNSDNNNSQPANSNNDPEKVGEQVAAAAAKAKAEPASREKYDDDSCDENELLRRHERLVKLKEGVDFIETEEDAEAVESAVVKIQSTFRGKKIRSKLGGQNKQAQAHTAATTTTPAGEPASGSTKTSEPASKQAVDEAAAKVPATNKRPEDEELNERVATMQVNDNSDAHEAQKGNNQPNLPEDEAERAATKIQAGFKGYKTRKELESKLGQQGAGQAPGSGQRQAKD